MSVKPLKEDNDLTYELHSLGWKAFQQLCATVLSEVLGQTVQVFSEVNDGLC
ncbi:MAG: hypothetical protein V7690_11260 [Shewanella sp.]